jgi:hypothetical protein
MLIHAFNCFSRDEQIRLLHTICVNLGIEPAELDRVE